MVPPMVPASRTLTEATTWTTPDGWAKLAAPFVEHLWEHAPTGLVRAIAHLLTVRLARHDHDMQALFKSRALESVSGLTPENAFFVRSVNMRPGQTRSCTITHGSGSPTMGRLVLSHSTQDLNPPTTTHPDQHPDQPGPESTK